MTTWYGRAAGGLWERNVLWSICDGPLLERLYARRPFMEGTATEALLEVAAIGVVAGAPAVVTAAVRCGADWSMRRWALKIDVGNDGFSTLTSTQGRLASSVQRSTGAEEQVWEVDAGAFLVWDGSASSHLPIVRSRGHDDGQRRAFEVPVLHVNLGNAHARAGTRRYDPREPGRWEYEDVGLSGGKGLIAVDEDGVVIEEAGVSRILATRFPRPASASTTTP